MRFYKFSKFLVFMIITSFSLSCKQEVHKDVASDYYESDFFKAVQMKPVFKDSKTFVDMMPKISKQKILALYEAKKNEPGFDLTDFVNTYYMATKSLQKDFITDTTKSMYEHISGMWPVLTRNADKYHPFSSRIPLPESYVVPGGRFREIYYWDSFFTLQGLLADNKRQLATDMVDNFSFLIDTLGFIPNGNRNYYLSRSQPPFYTLMVTALVKKDSLLFKQYFPQILKEYEYWTRGEDKLSKPFEAVNMVFNTDDGTVLNRYWDDKDTPREESYKEDIHLASSLQTDIEKRELYRNLRAAAASGWDFSSRWYGIDSDFGSTRTIEIAPVDLNCLLYFMEIKIADGYAMAGNGTKKSEFLKRAVKRKNYIQKHFWDESTGFFMDFDIKTQNTTQELTLAGVFPLYFKIANKEQAEQVKNVLMKTFLKPGGLVTTLKNSGQQWDAPNGWAPLQYMAVMGFLNYGYKNDAIEIMERWLANNERVYKNTGRMMEKYNVENIHLLSGGGEYETQDGFGWTNGVALSFKCILDSLTVKK